MRFGAFPVDAALGLRLAHTLRLPGRTFTKGRILAAADIAALRAAGLQTVAGARIDADEVDENAAAALAAALLAGADVVAEPAAHGRANLKASAAGVLRVDTAVIDAMNRRDEALTVGTLAPYAAVRPGQVVATVKAIPFAVARATLDAWREAAAAPPLSVAPFRRRRVALIATTSSATSEKLLATTAAVTRARLEALGSVLAGEWRCRHDSAAVAETVARVLATGAELILIAGASVSKDRRDTVPAGIVAAGGAIEHFGMPVEPGNMLLLARVGAVPVLNLPGCARSRRANGLDWVLQRLLADIAVAAADIMAMGVGGLIASAAEGAEADDLPETPRAARPARIAALVLAAGRSSRMGSRNKLLCPVGGQPMVRRAVDAALGSRCVQTLVVTGFDAPAVEAALAGCAVSLVHNAGHAEGIAASLRCGLRALPQDVDAAVVVLADMPRLTATHIDRLFAAFDPAAPAIVVPERDGRRGNPVLWPRRYFGEMLALTGDQGARGLQERHADNVVRVNIDDDAIFDDVDTPAELALAESETAFNAAPGEPAEISHQPERV